ncbi:MAG TPA: aminotransferase class V-fold PLP-dependent enzyme [Myxococcales bacterium]|jgi:glutamate/tyrosine decarboxylase-like PLP-dependent enzyme
MKIPKAVESRLKPLERSALRLARAIPAVRRRMEREYEKITAELAHSLKPYRGQVPELDRLPAKGVPREEVLKQMESLARREEGKWKEGYCSGAVYNGDQEHVDFLNRVYAMHSQVNPLHADIWPSASKYESEVVRMTAAMLGAPQDAPDAERVCGSVSSGGSESILLAMKTYRDRARDLKGIRRAEIIAPETAHAAFDKAAEYFGMRLKKIPVGQDFRANVGAARKALSRHTVVLVGSAPAFPHGTIDPIAELSEIARRHGIGFHTDACLGGFVLPFAERLGYPVPPFDFRLPGVTSMSVDTHKYGYAAKGTSVVLYRGPELRRYQYFAASDWPGGLYASPTFAGSRPGALVAAAWAALVANGEAGYLAASRRILETAAAIKAGIAEIPGLRVLGDPLFVIAFASDEVDVYRVMDEMSKRGWSLNGMHRPACVHLAVTLRHTQPGVAERFLSDLKAAVENVRATPGEKGGMAPVYGLAGNLPLRGVVKDLLTRYLDVLGD